MPPKDYFNKDRINKAKSFAVDTVDSAVGRVDDLATILQNNGIPDVIKQGINFGLPYILDLNKSLRTPVFLKLRGERTFWQLPFDPVVSVKGSNTIATRKIAKQKQAGTIKEYWAQDDYVITIKGVFIDAKATSPTTTVTTNATKNDDGSTTTTTTKKDTPVDDTRGYPYGEVSSLNNLLQARKELIVVCPVLEVFGIQQMVIQTLDVPFTKYENVQEYTITAVSDNSWQLLIEEKKKNEISAAAATKAIKDSMEDAMKNFQKTVSQMKEAFNKPI